MTEIKKTPLLRFPNFNNYWFRLKLGEIGKVSMCKRIMKDETSSHGDIPFYKIGTFGKVADAYINKEIYEKYKSNYSYPKKGEILIAASGATYGKTVVFDGKPAFFQDSNIVWIDNDESKVLNVFLNMQYQRIKWAIQESTIPRLYNDIIKNTFIYSTSISEQQKIASFLSSVDKKIKLLEQKKDLLEQYKKGVMQQIFSQQIRFKDDDGNDYPDWGELRIDDLFKDFKGKGIPKGDIVEEGQNDCILYGELYTKYNEIINEVVSKTDSCDGLKSEIGDLLIPTSTTTQGIDLANVTALNFENVLLGGDIMVLRAKKEINNIFYAYYLSNHKKIAIAKRAQGITIIHLYFSGIRDLNVDYPSILEQNKIADFLSAIDNKIELVNNQIDNTQNFKKGLLQQMFV